MLKFPQDISFKENSFKKKMQLVIRAMESLNWVEIMGREFLENCWKPSLNYCTANMAESLYEWSVHTRCRGYLPLPHPFISASGAVSLENCHLLSCACVESQADCIWAKCIVPLSLSSIKHSMMSAQCILHLVGDLQQTRGDSNLQEHRHGLRANSILFSIKHLNSFRFDMLRPTVRIKDHFSNRNHFCLGSKACCRYF